MITKQDLPKIEKRDSIKPRILLYDIETAPTLGFVWKLWETDVIEVEADWYVLSFAWKWLGEKTVHVKALPDYKLYKKEPENDIELMKDLHALMSSAHVVIGHNSDGFDNKKANTRFIIHKMNPPEPYRSVDTLKVARRYFKFDSNKLDDLAKYLEIGRKVHTGGKKLWFDCMGGVASAWARMKKYNKMDVVLLEAVYKRLLPWMAQHPNLGVFSDEDVSCPKCQSTHLQSRGKAITNSGTHNRFQCQDCGGWGMAKVKDKGTGNLIKNG